MVKHRTKTGDNGVKYTLYTITLGITKMLAPLMPHVTEDIYQGSFSEMDGAKSIHSSKWPEPVLISEDDELRGNMVKDVIAAIRAWKAEKGYPLNKELELLEVVGPAAQDLKGYETDILETSRAKELRIVDKADLVEKVVALKPIKSKIGPTFKANGKEIIQAISSLDPEKAADPLRSGKLELTLSDGWSSLWT